jgi:hypothetical protein
MIDGQPDRDGLFADPLIADLTEQAIGAQVESSTAFGDRQHVGAEAVAPFGLTEELMLRTQPLKLSKTRLQGFDVKLAPEREMVELVL